jgi:hypothetical protein
VRRSAVISVALALVVGLVYALAASAAAGDGNRGRLSARLTGEQEVPGPGDPDGSGSAAVHVRRSEVCFDLEWEDISAPTAAHIHFGERGVAGPVVVTFFASSAAPNQPPTLPETITEVGGCSDQVVVPEGAPFEDATELLGNIRRHPEEYYVNVHNLDFPDGAIRGQLRD